MLIQERVLAAKPEAMILAVAQLVLLASIGYWIPSKLQLLKVNLDDAWFS